MLELFLVECRRFASHLDGHHDCVSLELSLLLTHLYITENIIKELNLKIYNAVMIIVLYNNAKVAKSMLIGVTL